MSTFQDENSESKQDFDEANTAPAPELEESHSRPKRRIWQFSLKFLLVISVFAAFCSIALGIYNQAYQEQKFADEVRKLSGTILYDYQYRDGEFVANAKAPGPVWLRKRFGNNILTRINYVEITGAKIKDVEFLSGLTSVEKLILFNCQSISDIQFVDQFPELSFLDLGRCQSLKDIDELRHAKKLEHLDLYYCSSVKTIDCLNELEQLQFLNLNKCKSIAEFGSLAGLRNLKTLQLMQTQISSTDALAGLAKLDDLYLGENELLNNVDGLKSLTNLRILDLKHCPKLTKTQLQDLKVSLPNTNIISDHL